ncbi:MAG: VCBS repeat-containing protein, partial [Bacteroidota bacterium]
MSKPKPSKSQRSLQTQSRQSIRTQLGVGLVAVGVLLATLFATQTSTQTNTNPTFTNVAIAGAGNAGLDAAIDGSNDGGFAWGDINQDGFLDLVVNTNVTNTTIEGTRILIANGTDPDNPFFEDLTTTYCQHCSNERRERAALLADLNHDGVLDLIRNTSFTGIEIYLNQGAGSGYAFGTGSGVMNAPNKSIVAADFHDGQMNSEGLFLLDYNHDGWLDLGIENHNFGVDIFENPADGTANFFSTDPAITGLPTSATDGDYGTAADLDNDGDIDILGRKTNAEDYFTNDGDGTFTTVQNIANANNGNKGGVVVADFDNDGDFDLYWTDNDVNQIWINEGGVFVQSKGAFTDGEPWLSAGV